MDPSSLANAASVRASRFHLDLNVDFDAQIIVGTVRFDFDVHADGTDAVILDTSFLDIRAARLDNQPTSFTLGERAGALGAPLRVEIPEALRGHGSTFKLEIDYATTGQCTALHWLRPEQTEGKRHPYLFSQLQAIHARSFFPCQDTPSVKMTYSATVRVPVALTALMSARTSETDEAASDGTRTFRFQQPVAIPVRTGSCICARQ